jgi:hypothetical protein
VVTPALSLNTSRERGALVSLLAGRMGFQKIGRTSPVAAKQRGDGVACGRPTSILRARGSRSDRLPLQLAQDRAPREARKGRRSPPGPFRRGGASSQAHFIGYKSQAVVLGLLTSRKRRPYRNRMSACYPFTGSRGSDARGLAAHSLPSAPRLPPPRTLCGRDGRLGSAASSRGRQRP